MFWLNDFSSSSMSSRRWYVKIATRQYLAVSSLQDMRRLHWNDRCCKYITIFKHFITAFGKMASFLNSRVSWLFVMFVPIRIMRCATFLPFPKAWKLGISGSASIAKRLKLPNKISIQIISKRCPVRIGVPKCPIGQILIALWTGDVRNPMGRMGITMKREYRSLHKTTEKARLVPFTEKIRSGTIPGNSFRRKIEESTIGSLTKTLKIPNLKTIDAAPNETFLNVTTNSRKIPTKTRYLWTTMICISSTTTTCFANIRITPTKSWSTFLFQTPRNGLSMTSFNIFPRTSPKKLMFSKNRYVLCAM